MSRTALMDHISDIIRQHQLLTKPEPVLVGVSGGPDSVCLLHCLTRFCRDEKLPAPIVAHLNHQLRGEAAQADAEFVRSMAQQLSLDFIQDTLDVGRLAETYGCSVEEAGRYARYGFLGRVARQLNTSTVAVGHHADDQAETVLMHVLRGTGLTGLRGMRPKTRFVDLNLPPDLLSFLPSQSGLDLIRPLLYTPRHQIEVYCRAHNLPTRQDESNQDQHYFRNRIRHELLPLLKNYNPNIHQALQRTAEIVAADLEFIEHHLTQIWPMLVQHRGPSLVEVNYQVWETLPLALQRALLRRGVDQLGGHNLGFEHIEQALALVRNRQVQAKATLPDGVTLTLGYHTFQLSRGKVEPTAPDHPWLPPGREITVKIPGNTVLPQSGWQLVAHRTEINQDTPHRSNPWFAYLDAASLQGDVVLRTRQPGDLFQPLGMSHRKAVRRFMIDAKIPATERDTWPLLLSAGRIVWLCGHRPAEHAKIKPNSDQIVDLKFQKI